MSDTINRRLKMIRSLDQHLEHLEEENVKLYQEIAVLKRKLEDKDWYINRQRVIIAGYTK